MNKYCSASQSYWCAKEYKSKLFASATVSSWQPLTQNEILVINIVDRSIQILALCYAIGYDIQYVHLNDLQFITDWVQVFLHHHWNYNSLTDMSLNRMVSSVEFIVRISSWFIHWETCAIHIDMHVAFSTLSLWKRWTHLFILCVTFVWTVNVRMHVGTYFVFVSAVQTTFHNPYSPITFEDSQCVTIMSHEN
jgi:hypothetical protein